VRGVAGGADRLEGSTTQEGWVKVFEVFDRILMLAMHVSTGLRARLMRRRRARLERSLAPGDEP
jgi:hypothetical protein